MLILGDCLEVLKTLPDNSVDSIVTDPPAGISFMGKAWDDDKGGKTQWIAWLSEVFIEAKRVLKPGGHALVWALPRTSHWTATALEDAGYEVRDCVYHIFGSGFPKSLNIGKAVDKIQGNEREKYGEQIRSGRSGGILGKETEIKRYLDKGSSPWEGWGTALKPAVECWWLVRKPLSDGGVDIAKAVCYNMRENGFNNEIVWRIKRVSPAKKQKTQASSIITEQPRMVEVSVKAVSEKETQNIGIEIERLSERLRENTEMTTKKSSMKEVGSPMEQTRSESLPIKEHIRKSENCSPLMPMEESAYAAENQDGNSLPSIILEEGAENTEEKLRGTTSTYSLKNKDAQKTDTDCSASTATSQWVCMDIARTVKIEVEGKEYGFEQLVDGSFVWDNNLRPYREPRPLNVAENVLKHGTGGLNIDGSRVGTEEITTQGGDKFPNNYGTFKTAEESTHIGRFPAHLIHDGSEEVLAGFPNTKSGSLNQGHKRGKTEFYGGGTIQGNYGGDSGSAARFFQKCEIKPGEICRNINVSIVEQALRTIQATIPSTAPLNVEEWLDEQLVQNVSSAGIQCEICATSIALVLAEIRSLVFKREELLATQDFIGNFRSSTPILNLASIVAVWESIDTTPTTQNLSQLFGSVLLAIDENTNLVKREAEGVSGEQRRFAYFPKPSKAERDRGCEGMEEKQKVFNGQSAESSKEAKDLEKRFTTQPAANHHPTVKAQALMQYLIKLITPPKGTVLDPFMGSGSTGVAAKTLGFDFIGIEKEVEYFKIAEARIKSVNTLL